MNNLQTDLEQSQNYMVYENRGWGLAKNGRYQEAIVEYQKAIGIIQKEPGDRGKLFKKDNNGKFVQLSAKEMDQADEESRAFKQKFSRLRLVDLFITTHQPKEAIEQIDLLLAHKQVEHVKKELLAKKNSLQAKIQK